MYFTQAIKCFVNLKAINYNAVSDWRYVINVPLERKSNGVKCLMKTENRHQIFKLQHHLYKRLCKSLHINHSFADKTASLSVNGSSRDSSQIQKTI